MVLLRHTISTMYHGIIFKSCKKTQYITMKCVIGERRYTIKYYKKYLLFARQNDTLIIAI